MIPDARRFPRKMEGLPPKVDQIPRVLQHEIREMIVAARTRANFAEISTSEERDAIEQFSRGMVPSDEVAFRGGMIKALRSRRAAEFSVLTKRGRRDGLEIIERFDSESKEFFEPNINDVPKAA